MKNPNTSSAIPASLARARTYSILDPEERNSAFFKFHLDWFCEWGLAKLLADSVGEFALLQTSLTFLIIRKSRVKSDNGTELYVNEAGERTGVVALRPEFLVTKINVETFLRHELMHLQDMVDPAFGYQPAVL